MTTNDPDERLRAAPTWRTILCESLWRTSLSGAPSPTINASVLRIRVRFCQRHKAAMEIVHDWLAKLDRFVMACDQSIGMDSSRALVSHKCFSVLYSCCRMWITALGFFFYRTIKPMNWSRSCLLACLEMTWKYLIDSQNCSRSAAMKIAA